MEATLWCSKCCNKYAIFKIVCIKNYQLKCVFNNSKFFEHSWLAPLCKKGKNKNNVVQSFGKAQIRIKICKVAYIIKSTGQKLLENPAGKHKLCDIPNCIQYNR